MGAFIGAWSSSHGDDPGDSKPGSASGEGRKIPTPKLTGTVGSCDGYGWFGQRWGLSGSPKGLMDPNVVLVLEITDVMITGMFSEKQSRFFSNRCRAKLYE